MPETRRVRWCLDAPRSPPTDLHSSCPHLNDVFSASNFETLISAVWPSSDEARLRPRLKVIGWISDTDISLSSGITEATSAAAGKGGVRPHAHRLTPSEMRTPQFKSDFLDFQNTLLKMCFPYLVSILLMKKKKKKNLLFLQQDASSTRR